MAGSARVVSKWESAAIVVFLLSILALTFTVQLFSKHVKQTKKRNRFIRKRLFDRLGLTSDGERRRLIGFLHPYCNAGGGGERVLWQAVLFHLKQDSRAVIVIYSGDVGDSESLEKQRDQSTTASTAFASKESILSKCQTRFDIALNDFANRIHFLPLSSRVLVSDGYWKHFTLLGQAYGSMRMAFEACSQILPDVFIDTMGYGFAYPIVRSFSQDIPIAAYIHYPMISTDMLERVRSQQSGHTNSSNVAKSQWRTKAKLTYYQLFARLYSFSLCRANILVANGTWTQNHVKQLTGRKNVKIVYPPCDTASLINFPIEGRETQLIVSLAQFRPEKEQSTQLQIIKAVLDRRKAKGIENDKSLRLICMGSSRNEGDELRIAKLKQLSVQLGIEENISFIVNAPYSEILQNLSKASIGLSTMIDEHFGINVVEFMAAGLITLSHASAGPLLDIAVPIDGEKTGFHAKDLNEFAKSLGSILQLDIKDQLEIRKRARQRAIDSFSNESFQKAWKDYLWEPLSRTNELEKNKSQ